MWCTVRIFASKAQLSIVITYEVPDEDILMEDTSRLEAMVENLLQCNNQAVFSAQEDSKASSLWGGKESHPNANR